jgi:hypothetical protein
MAKGPSFYYSDSISSSQDVQEIKESIVRIIMTSPGERVMLPEFGSKFKTMLFESNLTIDGEIQSEIYNCISRWEPRVNIINISITNPDAYTAMVNIQFQIKATGQTVGLEFGYTQ